MLSIGENIRNNRKKTGVTQKELAKKINVSAQVISNFERGYTEPGATDIEKISEALHIPVSNFYNESNVPDWADEQDKMDLKKFLENQQEMYYGDIKLTEEEKKQLNDIVVGVFWKRMKEAKDKQIDKE